MRTRYKQVCKNCGHSSQHHKPNHCLHDIAHHPMGGSLMFGMAPPKDEDRIPCGCPVWDGITVIDSEETYDDE